jgi:hypothetical protein
LVEHWPPYPKVEGLSQTTAAEIGSEKNARKTFYNFLEKFILFPLLKVIVKKV